MATIRDVAKRSGVSIATVSHVLNNRASKVGADTREKVLAAVRELKYRPSAFEARQEDSRTQTLAFLVHTMSVGDIPYNSYFHETFLGAMQHAASRGYHMTVALENVWPNAESSIRRRFDGRCDGVILLAPRYPAEAATTFWQRGTPVVSIGSSLEIPGVSVVDISNTSTAEKATRMLLELGHTQVVYIGTGRETYSSDERARGYERAMLDAGFSEENLFAVFTAYASDAEAHRIVHDFPRRRFQTLRHARDIDGWGEQAVEVLLRELPETTAIVAWSESIAVSVYQELTRRGVRVPKDISIVTFDPPRGGSPDFTTFVQPLTLIGKTAARILIDQAEDSTLPAQVIRFEPDLVPGSTIAPPDPNRKHSYGIAKTAVSSNGGN